MEGDYFKVSKHFVSYILSQKYEICLNLSHPRFDLKHYG